MARPQPRRTLLLLLLPMLAVLVVAGLALRSPGDASEEAFTRRGRALLAVVESTVAEAGREQALVEDREVQRLLAVARRIEAEIRALLEPVGPVLARIAAEEGVGRIFLLDAQGRPIARIVHPEPLRLEGIGSEAVGDVDALEWEHAKPSMQALGRTPGTWASEGVVPNAFGTRERLGVVLALARGGALLVRAEQAALDRVRSRTAIAAVLDRMASVPDVAHIALRTVGGGESVDVEGTTRAMRTTAFVGRTETPQAGPLEVTLVLSRDRLEAGLAAQRRNIVLWSALALATAGLGLFVFLRTERARVTADRRRELELEGERRLAEMGALAGLIAHEVSSPLNAISLELGRLAPTADERGKGVLGRIGEQLATVRLKLESYLRLAQPSAQTSGGTYGLGDLERMLDALRAEQGGRIALEAPPPSQALRVRADPLVFDHALRNLLRNALQAARSQVRVTWRGAGSGLLIEVEDDGPGFPAEILASQGRLGQSLRGQGHGLGVALARRFLENQGSALKLGASELGGAKATIEVPRIHDPGVADA